MDALLITLAIVGVVVLLYASSRLRAQSRAGWVDVFTPIHGGEEFAVDFRSALNDRGIESRTRYPGVAGSPGVGMSGTSEVWISVKRDQATEAKQILNELLDKKFSKNNQQGDDE